VETLDRCFENVCELDLIFHVDKGAVQNRIERSPSIPYWFVSNFLSA